MPMNYKFRIRLFCGNTLWFPLLDSDFARRFDARRECAAGT